MKTKPCKIREDIHIVPLRYSTIWKKACENVCFWYSGLTINRFLPRFLAACQISWLWLIAGLSFSEWKKKCNIESHSYEGEQGRGLLSPKPFLLGFLPQIIHSCHLKMSLQACKDDWLGNPIRRKFANNTILLKLLSENRMDDAIIRSPSWSPLLKTRGVWPDL